ncbi:hypothetical protein FC093_11870 [Ilyomonas limi]|uniref:Uncharacterized protein n=1 Tax=Ilyomonas limi TaxID=2575867 RepID=A0A4V5UWB7_9BACT|nr:hypothetical protein [Ilyomonas limi]TKK68323.1 hypothetical protein FC093_11870 [Ilyomonas limi]
MSQYEEETFNEQESLQLITTMINKAKADFVETGISAIMWGSIISFCALVQFVSYFYPLSWARYVWLLTFLAVVPQIIISARERRRMKFKTYYSDAMSGIWLSFAITMFLLSFYVNTIQVPYIQLHAETLFLIVYGVPTFATGFTRRFTPMIIGGIACWVFAILAFYTAYPYTMLYYVAAAQLAWFIPGFILQRRYLKAKKQQHV